MKITKILRREYYERLNLSQLQLTKLWESRKAEVITAFVFALIVSGLIFAKL